MQALARRENFVCFYNRAGRPIRLLSLGYARKDAPTTNFFELFDGLSRPKAAAFWESILTRAAAFNWTLHLQSGDEEPKPVCLCGVIAGDDVLIVAVPGSVASPHEESYDNLSGIINELSVAHRQAAQNAKMLRIAVEAERRSLDQARISQSRLQFLARSAAACAQNIADVDALIREALSEAIPILGRYAGIEFHAALSAPIAQVFHRDAEGGVVSFPCTAETVSAQIAERTERTISVPLHLRNDRLGEICFGRDEIPYGEDERASAEQFSNIVSVALDNAIRYEAERSVSEQLQRAALPEALPASALFELGATYIVSSEGPRFIGGDWYDAFVLPDGEVALSVGDVTGHGLRAATTMAKIRAAVRVAGLNSPYPVEVLSRIHHFLSYENALATAIYARFNVTTLKLLYAIAGHPPPVLVRSGTATLLDGGGTPLGLDIAGASGPQLRSVGLQPGDRVIFYSDGLVEATRNLNDGLARLITAAATCAAPDQSVQMSVDSLVERVLQGADPLDDIVVLQVHMQ
jgi:serine phosphatase RsbU (regulator of sigma subunit)